MRLSPWPQFRGSTSALPRALASVLLVLLLLLPAGQARAQSIVATKTLSPAAKCGIWINVPGTAPPCAYAGAVGQARAVPGQRFRTLMRWDVNAAIPPGWEILAARISSSWVWTDLWGGTNVHVHEVTQPWTLSATWTTYDGVHPWETAGGDYGPDEAAPQPDGSPGPALSEWDVTDLVRRWYSGVTPNQGVVFRSPDETFEVPGLADTQLTITFTPSNYWASVQYGGANGRIDTPEEAAAIGAQLAGPNTLAIWNATAPADRDFLMDEEDANFGVWAPKVDTVGPARPTGINVDDKEMPSSRSSISWLEGNDPPLVDPDGAASNGSGGDEFRSQYRYMRAGGSWSAWTNSTRLGFNLSSTSPGDVVYVEVKAFDRAGNASAVASKTLKVPPATGPEPEQSAAFEQSHAFVVPVLVVGCAAYCVEAAAAVGATATSVAIIHAIRLDELSFGLGGDDDIKVTEVEIDAQTFDDFQEKAGRQSERRRFREEGRAAADDSPHGRIHAGEEGHHIVAVGAKAAEYARKVLWRCNLDPNDWQVNGAHPPYRYHRRMHTKAYYQAINRILRRYDPDRNITPCDPADPFAGGIRQVLADIAKYINRGKFPG